MANTSTESCGIVEVRNTEHATGAHDANNARDSLIEAPSILTNQFASGGIAISTSAADGLVVSKYGSGGGNTDWNVHPVVDFGPQITPVLNSTMPTNTAHELLVRTDPEKQGIALAFTLEEIISALKGFQVVVNLGTNHFSVTSKTPAFNTPHHDLISIQDSPGLTNVANLLSGAEDTDMTVVTGSLEGVEGGADTMQHNTMITPLVHSEDNLSMVHTVSTESTATDGIAISLLRRRALAARAQPFMPDTESCMVAALACRENVLDSRFSNRENVTARGLVASPRVSHIAVCSTPGSGETGPDVKGMLGGSCNREVSRVDGGVLSAIFVERVDSSPAAVGPEVSLLIQGLADDMDRVGVLPDMLPDVLTEAGVSSLGPSSAHIEILTLYNDVCSSRLEAFSELGEACDKVKAAENRIVVEATSQLEVRTGEGVLVPGSSGEEKASGEPGADGAVEEFVALEEVSRMPRELTDTLIPMNMVQERNDEIERCEQGKTREDPRLRLEKEEEENEVGRKRGEMGKEVKVSVQEKMQSGLSTQEHDSQMVINRGDVSLHPTDNAGNNNVHNTNTSLSSNEVSYAPAGPGGTGGGTVGGTAVNLALRVDKSKALAGSGMAVPCGGEAGDGGYEGTGPIGAEGGTGGGGSTPGMPMAGVGLYAGGVVPGTPNGRKGVHKGFVALARQNEPPVECAHAVTYVSFVKERFSHKPQTYHAFLKLLHAYKLNQRGVDDLVAEISSLFADHPDLLRKFIYFLPRRMQEQTREKLNRAGRESEICKATAAANAAKHNGRDHGTIPHPRGGPPPHQTSGPSHLPQKSHSRIMAGCHSRDGGGDGGGGRVHNCPSGCGHTAKKTKKGNQAKKKGSKAKKRDKKQARRQEPEMACSGKEMEVKVEEEKTASMGATQTHSFSFSPDVDASFLLSDPRERKTVAPAVTKVSTPSSRSAGFTFSSGCRVPEVSGASYCARHIHLHLTSDKTSRRGNGRAHVVAPPVGKEASSEDSMPPHSDTNCGGSDNSSQVFSLGTHLATRVAGKKKGRRPGR